MSTIKLKVSNEVMTQNLGNQLGLIIDSPGVIFLNGDLGAGKTLFTKSLLSGLGYKGLVKSPTYSIVEQYELNEKEMQLYHMDLYRLSDPEELEFFGIRDYFSDDSLCVIEWPENGSGVLPQADLDIKIIIIGKEREFLFRAYTDLGEKWCSYLTHGV